jgi:hypothetical protein
MSVAVKRHRARGLLGVVASLATAVIAPTVARADTTGYLVNITALPGNGFASASAALDYGYTLCDKIRSGTGYGELVQDIRTELHLDDGYKASYLVTQATQELCPELIWQVRQTVGGYRG